MEIAITHTAKPTIRMMTDKEGGVFEVTKKKTHCEQCKKNRKEKYDESRSH